MKITVASARYQKARERVERMRDTQGTHMHGLCEAMRAAREKSEVSLRTAAKQLGVSASYLSDIERGNRVPPNYIVFHYVMNWEQK